MIDRVLVAVDGSHCSQVAAAAGFALAKRHDAAVDVLSVATVGSADGDADERVRADRDRVDAALDDAGELAATAGVSVDTHRRDGSPADAVVDCSDDLGADLIVVGRSGRQGLGERFLGSVAERVLRKSAVPVLIVPDATSGPDAEQSVDAVLAPTDGSEAAQRAAPLAAAVAHPSRARIHVLGVADVRGEAGLFDAGGVSDEYVERLEGECEEDAQQYAELVRDAAGETAGGAPPATGETDSDAPATGETGDTGDGVVVDCVVERGQPHEQIAAYADEHGVDLIVMASTGSSSLTGQLLGSVADRVLRTTEVPVLVVPVR